jgi:hypothetical protein
MTVSRWEKERAAYLLGRTRPGSSGRRRAEIIGRRARRLGRTSAGLAETSMREDVTPTLFRRMLATSDGPQEKAARLFLVPMFFGIVGLLIGPALLVTAGLYGCLWYISPRIGRLWVWPWLTAGGVLAIGGGVILSLLSAGPGVWVEPWPPTLHIYPPVAVSTWLWTQITLGLLLTGLQVWQSGWAAVRPGAVPTPEKGKDGEFLKTPESKKTRLDPLAGVAVPGDAEKPGTSTRVKLAAFTLDDEPQSAPDRESAEEQPLFADEAEEFDLDDYIEGSSSDGPQTPMRSDAP